jgi:hypothetical protein
MLAMVLAAEIWHYWLAVFLSIGCLLTFVALLVGYLRNVEAPRFPRRQLR